MRIDKTARLLRNLRDRTADRLALLKIAILTVAGVLNLGFGVHFTQLETGLIWGVVIGMAIAKLVLSTTHDRIA